MPTISGSCHCGAVVFEVDLDKGLGRLNRCNCSLCRRRGAIMACVPLDGLRVVKGGDNLTLYQWNTRTAKHYFCKTCGIYTHHQRRSNPNEFAVNIACLDGVDPFSVGEVGLANGAALSVEPANRLPGTPGPAYVGFWKRTAAALIDSVLILVITLPILRAIYGPDAGSMKSFQPLGIWDVLLSYVLPAIAVILFWVYRSATPGKMLMSAEIVDATTGGKPSTRQLVIRYLGYYVSTIPLLLGLIWVAFDSRKQGWHDKLANTVVVARNTGT